LTASRGSPVIGEQTEEIAHTFGLQTPIGQS
jgi:hypothetical protein